MEQVKQYLYLGHLLTEDVRCETEIKRKLEIARTTFMNMRVLRLETRKKLIRCYIFILANLI